MARASASRASRFDAVIKKIGEAIGEIEELRDELQSWLDGLPENLQSGSKADMLQEAITALEDCLSNLEEAESTEVEFPAMYG